MKSFQSTDVKNTDTDIKENINVYEFPFQPDDTHGKGKRGCDTWLP